MKPDHASSIGNRPAKKYWAFISYSSKDRKWGQWLHKRLENYPIPPEFRGEEIFEGAVLGKNLRPIFRDRDELSGSSELGPAIGKALAESRFLIVLCSPNSAQSEWVNKEIEDFKSLGGEGNILALILEGEPNATRNPDLPDNLECFPPALRYPAEPLAGDLRKDGDGKERGFLKVLSGVAQLDFDKLYRRHERAQKRKLIGVASAFLIFLALAGGVAAKLYHDQLTIRNAHALSMERAAALDREKANALRLVDGMRKRSAEAANEGAHRAMVNSSEDVLIYLEGLSPKDPEIYDRIREVKTLCCRSLHFLGRNKEAVARYKEVLESLEQHSPKQDAEKTKERRWILANLPNILSYAGEHREAIQISESLMVELEPIISKPENPESRSAVYMMTMICNGHVKSLLALRELEAARRILDETFDRALPFSGIEKDVPSKDEVTMLSQLGWLCPERLIMATTAGDDAYAEKVSRTSDLIVAALIRCKYPMGWHLALIQGHQGDLLFLKQKYKEAMELYRPSFEFLNSVDINLQKPYRLWRVVAHFRMAAVESKLQGTPANKETIRYIAKGSELFQELKRQDAIEPSTFELLLDVVDGLAARAKSKGMMTKREALVFEGLVKSLRKSFSE
jgi:tetratricopeptide (TPR) repeat protein